MLAAWLMQQNTPRPITVGEGALVGLLSGLAGTVVWVVLWAIVMFVFSSDAVRLADFQRAMTEGGRDIPPEAREALENLSPAVILVVGGVIWAFVSLVFATRHRRAVRRTAAAERRHAARRLARIEILPPASAACPAPAGPHERARRRCCQARCPTPMSADRSRSSRRTATSRRPPAFTAAAHAAIPASTHAPPRDPEAFWAGFAGELEWITPWHAGARVEAAAREVVRRRQAQRLAPTASIATSARRGATRPRSSGKASRATAARSPTSICYREVQPFAQRAARRSA